MSPSTEQQQAIEAVLHVVSGHRRRPLVISSDRGRGKTALLGMAAAELIKQGKRRILVTAPSIKNCEPLFSHAAANLPGAVKDGLSLRWQRGEIHFIAADALIEQQPEADLLIVDEAAAIPAQMLEKLLQAFSRIVFASTLHGYEGTGRGFMLRFKRCLDRLSPDWRSLQLNEPIRWASDDELEMFSFEALLLDAEPADDQLLSIMELEQVEFEIIEPSELASNETLLREMFGLMVTAHYRTRPSDLQLLLDRQDISVAVLRAGGHIVASAWLVDEPALDDDLAQKVFDGQRRLKGHLLPQSLLAHAGLASAGKYHYQRIIRIAVHPQCQNKGLGSLLLDHLARQSTTCDVLGTSFAMDVDVVRFWLKNGYIPVRIGQHQDEVTGAAAVLMVKALEEQAMPLIDQAQQLFAVQWPLLLQTQLQHLPTELVALLAPSKVEVSERLEGLLLLQVNSFATRLRSYESSRYALWYWLQKTVTTSAFKQLRPEQIKLMTKMILQQQDAKLVSKELSLKGKAELLIRLRQAVSDCLFSASAAIK